MSFFLHVTLQACTLDQILPVDYVMIRMCTYHATKVIDTGHDMVLKIFFLVRFDTYTRYCHEHIFFEVITHHTFAFVHVKKQI